MSNIFFKAILTSGHGRGHHIGVPTLNLQVERELPKNGVYAVRASFANQTFNAVMHVGPRPTFREEDISIEVHLLDFEGEVEKGESVEIEILGRLRDVMSFDSTESLKKQIEQDMMQATSLF